MKKGLVVVAVVFAGAILAWTAGADKRGAKPKATPRTTKNAPAKGIQWRPSLQAALAEAKRTGKPVMADFYADWCGPCKILDEAYKQPNVIAESRAWVPVKVNVDFNQTAARTYNASSLPTMIFFDARGKEISRKVGFSVPDSVHDMKGLVKYLSQDVTSTMQAARRAKAKKV